jgi:succinate dehydrogenase / fumarate reductase cytochrome b subunit
MSWLGEITASAVGKKAVMAVSGIVLFGYVLLHMLGNLKLYEGPQKLNDYAGFLREVGSPLVPPEGLLWLVRAVLLAAVVLHVWAAWSLTRMSRAARPQSYARREAVAMSYASRTMRWGGVILLLFVVYHLLHLTTGTAHGDFVPGDVYHNVVTGFRVWWVSLAYIAAQVALGLHLYHGLWSMFQTLGWNHPRYNAWRKAFAQVFAWVVTLGNVSFPLAVLSGIITL